MSATTDQIARPDDRGERARALVRHAQQRLQSLGYNLGKLGVDGELYVHEDGSPGFTAKAILDFREAHSLGNQVQVDPDLLTALDDAVKRENETPVDSPANFDATVLSHFATDPGPRDRHPILRGEHGIWSAPGLVRFQSKADIDSDGTSATLTRAQLKHADPDWQDDTALHWPTRWKNADGEWVACCDSYAFHGFVLPPEVSKQYGIRLGDCGIACYGNKIAACQFADVGPHGKLGEFFVALAAAVGLDHNPRIGNDAGKYDDNGKLLAPPVDWLVFPGSGDGHAWDAAKQLATARTCVERMLA